jgi:parallel beta-helix repeat protein
MQHVAISRSPALLAALMLGLALTVVTTGTRHAAAQAQPQQCPVVVENTTLKTDCVGPMIVASDNVNVNLATHQVICTSQATDGIVLQNRTNVRIDNGHVHNCRFGIFATGGGSHHFTNLHLDQNSSAIHLAGSSGNTMSDTELVDNDAGVVMQQGSNGNRLEAGMVIARNRILGVSISSAANNNVILASSIVDNGRGIQIVNADGNSVYSSKIMGSSFGPQFGVVVTLTSDTLLQGNEVTQNSRAGVSIDQSSNVTVLSNHIHDNTGDGLIGQAAATGLLVRHNTVRGNTQAGIRLALGATGNVVESNTSRSNAGFDLEDDNPNCDANVWMNNNNVTENQPCID